MKVAELLEEINACKERYGDDFLDWDAYTEQISPLDMKYKKKSKWENFINSEGWVFFKCEGFWIRWEEKKIFTINVNY